MNIDSPISEIYSYLNDFSSANNIAKSNNKPRVLVGLSGGVDSSVAAALLLEQGFDVIALTITPFKVDETCKTLNNPKNCCTLNSYADAMDVSRKLSIPHKFMDLTSAFKEKVIDNFISEYLNGRTPNPCARCNPGIKWEGLLQKADEFGADFIATGHYAKILKDELSGRYVISRGNDLKKDQSYFLWGLSQEQLSRTIFPLGNLTKKETREIAERYELPVATKIESQEICFIPNNDYHDYLEKHVPDLKTKAPGGDFMFHGEKIGKHNGIPFYTVGQRKGLGISFSEPIYVSKINTADNIIELDTEENLMSKTLRAENINLIKYAKLIEPKEFMVKIRYRDEGLTGKCNIGEDGLLNIEFKENRRAITPGQSVVLYEGNDLVLGGVIM